MDLATLMQQYAADGAGLAATVDAVRAQVDLRVALSDAQRLLASCTVVGLVEQFDATVAMTCDLLAIAPPRRMPILNRDPALARLEPDRHRRSGHFPADVIARAEAMCQFDQELYSAGCALFAEQWTAYQARPRRSIHWMRSLHVQLGVRVLAPLGRWIGIEGKRLVARRIGARPRALLRRIRRAMRARR